MRYKFASSVDCKQRIDSLHAEGISATDGGLIGQIEGGEREPDTVRYC